MIPSRIVCKQRKRNVLRSRKLSVPIEHAPAEAEIMIPSTVVRQEEGSDSDNYSDEASTNDSSDTSDTGEDHSLTPEEILHDSAD